MPVTTELAPVDHAYTHVLQRQLVTSVGVAPGLLRELTSYDVGCLLVYSGTLEDMSKWVIADLLVWGEEKAAAKTNSRSGREFWQERDAIWDQLMEQCKLDVSKHTVYNMAATAKAFPWERRRHTETLSFEHHRIVSSRSTEEQEYWLDLAEDSGLSVARLRGYLYGDGDPLAPTVTVMSTRELWPIEQIEREVYQAFGLPTRWDTVERIKELIIEIKGDYSREIEQARGRAYPKGVQDKGGDTARQPHYA